MTAFSGAAIDSREVRPGMIFVALKGERTDGRRFIPQALAAGAVGVVEGTEELAAVARAYRRRLKAKVIGVTGSAGKTTTKELLKAFLSCVGKVYATEGNHNNHIGLPLTILNCPADMDFLVLEMGSNHPGEIAALCDVAEPDAGLVTNVGTAHLEFFKTPDGIAGEKGVLLARAKDFAVAGSDNSRIRILKEMRPGLETVGAAPGWLAEAMQKVLPGEHNASNAALAFAVAERFGVTREQAVRALGSFALPGSRWRRCDIGGVHYIDDTYNANPDAMIAALEAFAKVPAAGRRIAVLGDMFELGDGAAALHRRVFDRAAALGLDAVIAVGEKSSACPATLKYQSVESLKKSFPALVKKGDTVLLKASHGMNLGALLA
ncbi:MAG: hypothetical protein K6F50_09065 [Kiritimatiellae bacterium]|nr:hypothetical protein [Kiritimatiellia bacterium]